MCFENSCSGINDNSYINGINKKYRIFDDFRENKSQGVVNSTLAADGKSKRVVNDPNNKLMVQGGELVCIGGDGGTNWGQSTPKIFEGGVVKALGQIIAFRLKQTVTSGYGLFFGIADGNDPSFGISTGKYCTLYSQNDIFFRTAGGAEITFGLANLSLNYFTVLFILRASGKYCFLKRDIDSYWTLFCVDPSVTIPAVVYPSIQTSVAQYKAKKIYAPKEKWLPVPLLSDGFNILNISDGSGHAETSGLGSGGAGVIRNNINNTWSLSSGKLINTPNLSSEKLLDTGFDDVSKWAPNDANITVSGSKLNFNGLEVNYKGAVQNNVTTVDKWVRCQLSVVSTAGNVQFYYPITTSYYSSNGTIIVTGRATNTATLIRTGSSSLNGTVDDASVKELTLFELFNTCNLSTTNINISTAITRPTSTFQSGIVLSLDSASNPQNFVIIYLDGTNIKVDKCVNGVYTNVRTTSFTYSAGARLVIVKNGTSYAVYYNNALIGSSDTISDAGIINNTLCGEFSTDSSISFDNTTVYALGLEGQYNILNRIAGGDLWRK